jgi:hypothetical protein
VNLLDSHYIKTTGPYATIRACRHCKHFEKVLKGLPHAGRGYGMREGNKARGRIIQHIKTAHPEVLERIKAGTKNTE